MFEQVKKYVADYRLYRRTVEELNTLSDRELGDLSISRADITRIAREAVALSHQPATVSPLRNRAAFA
ncbi:MAG: DUF1127 domain-containing protein [Paracoccaceae bacterium]